MVCFNCQHPNRSNARFCAQCAAPLFLQNKYRIVGLIGRGGFGAVYLAEQEHLGRVRCAIKEMFADPSSSLVEQQQNAAQFQFEASVLARQSHPMLPKVTDFFSEGGRYYLAMEYVEGETLEERLRRAGRPLLEPEVVAWAVSLCQVLEYLHTRQPNPVIHRDLKPSNIKITPDGSLKLLDFGIAKLLTVGQNTANAARAVSPPYAPLEQYGRGTDTRSDIYALGVTMYQLLTNHLPPDAPDRASQSVIPPRQHNPNLSAAIEAVVLKAMAQSPADRFASARDMRLALQGSPTLQAAQSIAQAHARVATVPPAMFPTMRWALWLIPVGVLVLALISFMLYSIVDSQTRANGIATRDAQGTQSAMLLATNTAYANMTATADASNNLMRAHGTRTAIALATAQFLETTNAAQHRQETFAAQTRERETARANNTHTAQAQLTSIAFAVQETSDARATQTTQAELAETATVKANQTATRAAAHRAATVKAARPFGENFTLGRDHIADDCTVAIQTQSIAQSAFQDDEWVYFATPFRTDQIGDKLYWTVRHPDGSLAWENIERELASDKDGCFWQGFGLGETPPTGTWRLTVEYQARIVYEVNFQIY